jgi:hypothetical protein
MLVQPRRMLRLAARARLMSSLGCFAKSANSRLAPAGNAHNLAGGVATLQELVDVHPSCRRLYARHNMTGTILIEGLDQ